MSSVHLFDKKATAVTTRRFSAKRHSVGVAEFPRERVAPAPRVKSKSRTGEYVVCYTLGFLFVAGIVYMASSLAGHFLLERSRLAENASLRRIEAASKAVAVLKDEVNRLETMNSDPSWVTSRGFIKISPVVVNNAASL